MSVRTLAPSDFQEYFPPLGENDLENCFAVSRIDTFAKSSGLVSPCKIRDQQMGKKREEEQKETGNEPLKSFCSAHGLLHQIQFGEEFSHGIFSTPHPILHLPKFSVLLGEGATEQEHFLENSTRISLGGELWNRKNWRCKTGNFSKLLMCSVLFHGDVMEWEKLGGIKRDEATLLSQFFRCAARSELYGLLVCFLSFIASKSEHKRR